MRLRAPVELFWQVIGDPYVRIFKGASRRPIDATWQAITDLAADVLERARELRDINTIYRTKHDLFWGTVPIDLEDATIRVPVAAIGKRQDAFGRWELFVSPMNAAERVVAALGEITWPSGQVQEFFTSQLWAPGIWMLRMTQEPAIDNAQATLFYGDFDAERYTMQGSWPFTPTDSGLRWDPVAINWSVLIDRQLANPVSGDLVVTHEVSGWTRPGNSAASKYLQVGFMSSTSTFWRVRQRGSVLKVQFGADVYSMSAMTLELGTLDGLRDMLEATSNTKRLTLTFRASFDASSATVRLAIEATGFRATASLPWNLESHYVETDVFNGWGTTEGRLISIVPPTTEYNASLATGRGTLWRVTPELSDAAQLTAFPWRLAARGTVTQRNTAAGTFGVQVSSGTPPAQGRVDVAGESCWCALSSFAGGLATYLITTGPMPAWGPVEVEPWCLERGEFVFEGAGYVRTKLTPPVRLWAKDGRVTEAELYSRFGDLLKAPNRPDSPSYLALLRGMYYALHTRPSPENLETAVNWMLGVPSFLRGGVITLVEDELDAGGEPLGVRVTLDTRESVLVPWSLRGRVEPVGTLVPSWRSPVRAARVWDLITNPEVIEAVTQTVWARPHTFVVEIPSALGLSQDLFELVLDTIRRARDPHTMPVVQTRVEIPDESMQEGNDGGTQRGQAHAAMSLRLASSDEDLLFTDFQSVVGNANDPNTEEQTPEALELTGQQLSAEGRALDQDHTAYLEPVVDDVGRVLGAAYPIYTVIRMLTYWVRRAASAKDALAPWETALGLSRTPLRLQAGWTGKPVELNRVLDEADALYTWFAGAWVTSAGTPSPFDLFAVYFSDVLDITIGGDGGRLWRSTNYGLTWSALVSPTAAEIYEIHNGWGRLSVNNSVIRQDSPTVWSAVSTGFAGMFYCVHAAGDFVGFGGEDDNGFGYGYLMFSLNGGSSWSERTFSDLSFGDYVFGLGFDDGLIWAAMINALRSSPDGVTWTDVVSGSFRCVTFGDVWSWAGGGSVAGELYRREAGGGAWEAVTLPGGVDIIERCLSLGGDDVLIVDLSGVVWTSRDAGGNWTASLSSANLEGVHATRWEHRMAVGTSSYLRRYQG